MRKFSDISIIILAGALLFIPFIGRLHLFDWDEINFAQAAHEMIIRNNYDQVTMGFVPFYEKPPLFFWVQVVSMKTFGVNEFAARFPNAVVGIVSLLAIYFIGSKVRDRKFALLWVLAYAGSILPHLYFKSGIIDPLFNLFMFAGLWFGFESLELLSKDNAVRKVPYGKIITGGIFIGFAVLTKGPVGILLPGLVLLTFLLFRLRKYQVSILVIITALLSILILPALWIGWQYFAYGADFLREFIVRNIELFSQKDAGHGGFFLYHWIVVFFGVFPASVFALGMLKKNPGRDPFQLLMIVLFFTVLVVFTIVKTKIVHYSSLCYFPLTFLAAEYLSKINFDVKKASRMVRCIFLITGYLISLAFLALPVLMIYRNEMIHLIHDPFTAAALGLAVNWNFSDCVPGMLLFLAILTYQFRKLLPFPNNLLFIFPVIIIVLQLALIKMAPKIEMHSQRSMIEFIENKSAGEDCYINTLGLKSYAPYFYSTIHRVKVDASLFDVQDILEKPLNKPAYFITKVQKVEKLKSIYGLKELYRKGGFVFLAKARE